MDDSAVPELTGDSSVKELASLSAFVQSPLILGDYSTVWSKDKPLVSSPSSSSRGDSIELQTFLSSFNGKEGRYLPFAFHDVNLNGKLAR